MVQKEIRNSILNLVQQKPRTVQEIAQAISKNWRTADRYVEIISQESGLIASRIFREGTRGALKIVYWNALDKVKGSAYQEMLLNKILNGRKKEDFSPLDIYQLVNPAQREAFIAKDEFSQQEVKIDLLFSKAQQQILLFSGNLSWLGLEPGMYGALSILARRKIKLKILTRVDITSQKNTEKILLLNQHIGYDTIEIRHCEQPLRALIIDDSMVSLKEVMSQVHCRELNENKFLYYLIKDPEWVSWMQKVFWHLWERSINAEDRLKTLESVNPK